MASYAQVTLVPAEDLAERGWLATFDAPDGQVRTYVDITTPPRWRFTTLQCVDLDLDVVQGLTGRVWVDDEDEFAEHRERWAYPEIVVVSAVASCEAVERAVRTGAAPSTARPTFPGWPGWPQTERVHIEFRGSPRPTLGVEWEFALVDRRTRDLANCAEALFEATGGQVREGTLDQELLRNTVEVVTGVCDTVGEAVDDLRGTLGVVLPAAADLGVDLFGAGAHPFAAWSEQHVTAGHC